MLRGRLGDCTASGDETARGEGTRLDSTLEVAVSLHEVAASAAARLSREVSGLTDDGEGSI